MLFKNLTLTSSFLILLFSINSFAQEAFTARTVNHVLKGQDKPGIIIDANVGLDKLVLKLKRSDGKKINMSKGPISPGSTEEFRFDQPAGTYSYKGKIIMYIDNQPRGELVVNFKATVSAPLKVDVPEHLVDIKNNNLILKISGPASKAEIRVWSDSGEIVHENSIKFNGEKAGSPLKISWEIPENEKVLKISITAYDNNNFFNNIELIPWSVQIPHEEVVFEFGSAKIRKSEKPKLKDTIKELREIVNKYGKIISVKLFIAGYTDTVGSPKSNLRLSEQRAKSIAVYLRKKGFKYPIYYQGFGESIQAVATPDETPEEKNRRAIYQLAADIPAKSTAMPYNSWKKLK